MIPIKPFYFDMTEEEIHQFTLDSANILRSGNLILGEYTKRFERAFAEFIGVKHAISVNSGSTALEILLRLKQVERKTVLVPTNTNFATVAAVIRAGGQVQYLDMDKKFFVPTLSMVQEAVESSPERSSAPIAGVLWVHIGGVISSEFPDIVRYCRKHSLFILEDAAHAHGSQLNGIKVGNLADGAAFSFFPTKVMTTSEGGMITTNDDEEQYLAESYRNQGKRGMSFGGLHHDFGNSSRLPEVSAALGLIQLHKLPEMLQKRAALHARMTHHLDQAGIEYVSTAEMDMASHYKFITLVPTDRKVSQVKEALSKVGIFSGGGVYDLPCHRQPVFEHLVMGKTYPGADQWCPNHLCPPLTTGMTEAQAEFVGENLAKQLS